MSSSERLMRELAVKLCDLITEARTMSAGADTMTQAKQAGRIVTESIKLAPDVKAIPPILLSCAMALWTCAKHVENKPSIEIVRVPDWKTIGYDDRRIMRHPLHKKAMKWISSVGEAKDVRYFPGWSISERYWGQHKNEAEVSTSHQSLTEEASETPGTLRMLKPRTFGLAKRKAADRKGKGVEQEQEDSQSHKGEDQEVVKKNTQQHLSHKRGRKRRRIESLDNDLQIDELMEGPSNNLKYERGRSIAPKKHSPMLPTGTQEDRKQVQFLSGMYKEEAEVFLWQGARDCRKGSKSREVSHKVEVTPEMKLSSVPPTLVQECAAMNSMEGRLIMLEAGLSRLNTAIQRLGGEHEALRQKVIPQHHTVLLPHGPSMPLVQTPMSEPSSSGEPGPIPPATHPSPIATLALQADAAQLSGAGAEAMDFGINPIVPEARRYRTKNINAIKSS
ncbi:hypothetical protein BD769DRAFT_1392805 [Suillus cothurnatus]|nr:hypothetical protein BD769DRAFT_1392805 [Suillus cothurnatus]